MRGGIVRLNYRTGLREPGNDFGRNLALAGLDAPLPDCTANRTLTGHEDFQMG